MLVWLNARAEVDRQLGQPIKCARVRSRWNPTALCHTPLVERTLHTRRALAATLTAAAAIAAHGGPALMADPRWVATAALAAGSVTVAAAAAARGFRTCSSAPLPPAMWVTAATLLAAQLTTHGALILAGVHAGMGQAGVLALHASLALMVATLLHAADSWLSGRVLALASAFLSGLRQATGEFADRIEIPHPRPHAATSSPRAPPALA